MQARPSPKAALLTSYARMRDPCLLETLLLMMVMVVVAL